MNRKRGYLQISFAWMFAIMAGIAILVLAFYAVSKINNTGNTYVTVKNAKQIGVLLDPLQTGFESSVTAFTMPAESQIFNKCNNLSGYFGDQGIMVKEYIQGKWTPTNLASVFENKYIFSRNPVEGQNFFVFSKSFEFPYKVADLIYMTSSNDKYCFKNPPSSVQEEISKWIENNDTNLFINNCPAGSTTICFNGESCDINVNQNLESVSSINGTVYYYGDALMYAAIFSNPQVYECQSSRLIQRAIMVGQTYNSKEGILSDEGCHSNIDVAGYINDLQSYTNSQDWATLSGDESQVNQQDTTSRCELW